MKYGRVIFLGLTMAAGLCASAGKDGDAEQDSVDMSEKEMLERASRIMFPTEQEADQVESSCWSCMCCMRAERATLSERDQQALRLYANHAAAQYCRFKKDELGF